MLSRLIVGGVAVAVLTGGCLGLPSGETQSDSQTAKPWQPPSPTGTPAQTLLAEALQRSQQVAFRFTVEGDLPGDDGTIKATGAFDPTAKLFESTIQISSQKDPVHRIVVGTDSYLQQTGGKWVHLDLKRVKPDALVYFDMTDATGLVKFTTRVESAEGTAATGYKGRFDAGGASPEFLPVGAPSLWVIGGAAPFTATVDGKGWVTTITVELTDKDRTVKLTTTMSGHGEPLQIKAPAKKSVVEADDLYYR
ncbi:hypothetical protein ACFPIJ_31355 [Dactylosporangium cerinum]|uniref:Lipoprotein n=1 Tax=Dactylosporangium cerinum TaxID=1434730 RepID=A0ABV9W3V7_9ACTN